MAVPPRQPARATPLWFLFGATLIVIVSGRIAGPSDVDGHDQPRTLGCTMDMALGGSLVLPVDTIGVFATKPPLYNWMALPTVAWLGRFDEWSHKSPALIGGAVTAALCFFMTRWMLVRKPWFLVNEGGGGPPIAPLQVALGACAIWLSAYPTFKMIYLARPDPVLMMCLTAAWVCGTMLVTGPRRSPVLATALWIAIAGAAMSKGPAAIVAIVYIVLAARLLGGRWSLVHRTGWWIGLPVVVGLFGLWVLAAHRENPAHVEQILSGEVTKRFTDSRYGDQMHPFAAIVLTAWQIPGFFFSRFAPWCIPAFIMLIHVLPRLRGARRRWADRADLPPTRPDVTLRFLAAAARSAVRKMCRHAMGPALLWGVLLVVFFSLVPFKRADYLVPAYVPASAAAAYALLLLLRRFGITPNRLAAFTLLVAIGVVVQFATMSRAARQRHGDHVVAFAKHVRAITGDDPIEFHRSGYNGLQALLGHHQPRTRELALRWSPWLIRPITPDERDDPDLLLISDTIPDKPDVELTLGLFRRNAEMTAP